MTSLYYYVFKKKSDKKRSLTFQKTTAMKSQKLISLALTMLFYILSFGQEKGIAEGVNVFKKDSLKTLKTEIRICAPSRNGLEPIYVVDGLVFENSPNIDPKQIESIDILKDAAAISLYGDKAKNGVVLITTKKKPKK